ncbi:MAG: hypothetical protein F4Z18_10590 [Caldilineaceae bacterium SB0666_bin_21]|nr:hypothetical protein [Caldilineaceae bacterium SB0666_bin_21]
MEDNGRRKLWRWSWPALLALALTVTFHVVDSEYLDRLTRDRLIGMVLGSQWIVFTLAIYFLREVIRNHK